jgi:putative intracellular protease/amidase
MVKALKFIGQTTFTICLIPWFCIAALLVIVRVVLFMTALFAWDMHSDMYKKVIELIREWYTRLYE